MPKAASASPTIKGETRPQIQTLQLKNLKRYCRCFSVLKHKTFTKKETGKRKRGIRISHDSLDRSELVNIESVSQVKYLLIEM